ncbi:23 kDa jasmonate-induced protein-like [Pyrus ussuriensis x Pyrus communis]|uniref:23 kDa jasmonate-induced protein-like n=1 Tax=Pyrus ussuriensis x Pyrus communis TaxID=2448454 RepID=A0A5N5G6U9_9ROSA|nr:23 kDa jasmonate-induced protein-like [Pyrus ussuriensis x Pyrus communis]
MEMVRDVFGNPITTATLEGMPEYRSESGEITRIERARAAMVMQKARGKDYVKARAHAEHLKDESGTKLANLVLIYNATGDTVRCVGQKDWIGLDVEYPPLIGNGQWAAFLTVKNPSYSYGSTSAVVYRGKNADGTNCDYMLSWSNPANRDKWDNAVCTQVRRTNHFDNRATWSEIYNHLDTLSEICNHLDTTRSSQEDTWNGCTSIITTDSAVFAVVEGTLTLEDV